MNEMGKLVLTAVLSVALVGAGVTGASASSETGRDRVQVVASKQFTGEDLFRGVVFGQGPARDVLGNLTARVAVTPDVAREIDRIVSDVRREDPDFFDDFADLAQSGDVVRVKDAFARLGAVLETALDNLGYTDGSNSAVLTPRCIQIVLFAVGAVVYAGAAILQVAAVAVSVWYAGPRSATSQPELSYEKWIAEATVRLAR